MDKPELREKIMSIQKEKLYLWQDARSIGGMDDVADQILALLPGEEEVEK